MQHALLKNTTEIRPQTQSVVFRTRCALSRFKLPDDNRRTTTFFYQTRQAFWLTMAEVGLQ